MSEPSTENILPPELRWLKTLVMVLTGVMILGVLLIAGLMIVKLRSMPAPGNLGALPPQITLPEAQEPQAVTFGPGWIGVVTTGGKFLVFDRTSGAPIQSLTIDLPEI